MNVIPLVKLAEEAGYIAEGQRNLMGAIQNVRTFEDNFTALDQMHHGAFAFIAFHPVTDEHVSEYIKEGSLGDDAGPHILALFLAGMAARAPGLISTADPLYGVQLAIDEHPAYALAREFFLSESLPQLPGLVYFDALAAPTQAIYIPIEGVNKSQIKAKYRTAFDAAQRSITQNKEGGNGKSAHLDFDLLAARLVEIDMPYRRAGEKGLRAAAFFAGAWVKKNAGAVVSVIPKLASWAAKANTGGVSGAI